MSGTGTQTMSRKFAWAGTLLGLPIFLVAGIVSPEGLVVWVALAVFVISTMTLAALNWMEIAGYPDVRVPAWLWALPGAGVVIFGLALYLGFLGFAFAVGGGLFFLGMGIIAAVSWYQHQ